MVREKIVAALSPDEDFNQNLRPQRMQDMIGQREVCERLRIAIDAARKRGEALGHVLFDGPPGLGQDDLRHLHSQRNGRRVQLASGAVLKAPKDLVPYLTNAEERSVLFIDEIHRLPQAVEEYLYTAMEDFRIDIVLGEGVNARTHNLWLKPFTMIGATTRAGMLSGPLRDRFQLREHLGFYSVDELTTLVVRNARKLTVPIDEEAAARDRRRGAVRHRAWPTTGCGGCGTTRRAGRTGASRCAVAHEALDMAGIDVRGAGHPGPPLSGHADPRVRRGSGRRRGHRPHHEHGRRHAGGRSGAVPAADRVRGADAARPHGHLQGLPASAVGRRGKAAVLAPRLRLTGPQRDFYDKRLVVDTKTSCHNTICGTGFASCAEVVRWPFRSVSIRMHDRVRVVRTIARNRVS